MEELVAKASPGADFAASQVLANLESKLFNRRRDPVHVGRYIIERRLGSGGSSTVYCAYDPQKDRRVALKLLHPGDGARQAAAQARLFREAQTLAKIDHPNVVKIYDVGTYDSSVFEPAGPTKRSGEPGVYVAMELIDGMTLDSWLRVRPRTWREIRDVFVKAAWGLAAAHAKGLIHRDFKPANVLVGRDGRVRVADFGLARNAGPGGSGADVSALSGSLEQLTATGAMVGTPRYMAPEQFGGGRVDARADQFSFCVALYEALWGRPPFAANTAGELLFVMTTEGPAPPPPTEVPPAIWQALRRGLSAKPDQRFESMRALMIALQSGPARRRSSPLPVVLGVVAVVLLAGGIGAWLLLTEPTDDETPVETKVAEAQPDSTPDPTHDPTPELKTDSGPKPPEPEPEPAPAAEPVARPETPNAPPDPGAHAQALSALSDTNMFEDPLGAYAQVDQAAAGGASDLSIAGALLQGIMPQDAGKAAPREPAWDQTQTLTCGVGDNLVIRDATIEIAAGDGPAFSANNGCILRIEGGTITADVIVQTQHAKSVELNNATVTARKTVVDTSYSPVTLRELTMTEPAGETAIVASHARVLVVESDLSGATAIDAKTASAIELEGGSITGTDSAAIARHDATIRTDGTTIKGKTQEMSTGTIEVRR